MINTNKILEEFEKLTQIKATETEKLCGYSNLVFRIKGDDNKNYLFKVLSAKENDPFKQSENKLKIHIHKVREKPILESDKHVIERYISSKTIDRSYISDKNNLLLIMRPIARLNKTHEIDSDKPHLNFLLGDHKDKLYDKIHKNLEKENVEFRNSFLLKIEQVETILKKIEKVKKSKLFEKMVLSHVDAYYKNLLYDLETSKHVLIDFEYVGYNPLGMDVFNFFNEIMMDYEHTIFPFFRVDYSKFPDDLFLKQLIKFFLFFYHHESSVSHMCDDQHLIDFVNNSDHFKNIHESEVDDILNHFPIFGVIVNGYWFFWSLYNGRKEEIDFNYFEFALLKMDMILYFFSKLNVAN